MSLFEDYISYPVRTLSIRYSIDEGDEQPFCIVREIILDDMVENLLRKEERHEVRSTDDRACVNLSVCYGELSPEMAKMEGKVIPLFQNRESPGLVSVLPQRHGAVLLGSLNPPKINEVVTALQEYPALKPLIGELSKKYMGKDVSDIQDIWGVDLLILSNPIYRNLDFTEQPQNDGLFCRVNYRKGRRDPLELTVTGKSKEGKVTESTNWVLDGSAFLYRTNLPVYHSLDIEVKDKNGRVLDQYLDMHFIRKISVNVKVH